MSESEDALRDLAAASSSGEPPVEPELMQPRDAADALAASSRPESPLAKEPKRPDAPPTVERDVSEMSASALAQLSGTENVAYDPGMHSGSRRKKRVHKPDVSMIGMRTASIPVLITMGLVMIALGVWAIMIKAGNETLPMADQPNADQLAILGLVGLPIGVLLFASAGFMFYMVGKDKKKLARWEELHGEDND